MHSFYESLLSPFMSGPVLRNQRGATTDALPALGKLTSNEAVGMNQLPLDNTFGLVLSLFVIDLEILAVCHLKVRFPCSIPSPCQGEPKKLQHPHLQISSRKAEVLNGMK